MLCWGPGGGRLNRLTGRAEGYEWAGYARGPQKPRGGYGGQLEAGETWAGIFLCPPHSHRLREAWKQ